MKKLLEIHGIVTVLNTPFDADNKVELASVRRNVAEALAAGVAGFLVPAMASEVYHLTSAERLDLVACVLDAVHGKRPVFAGAGAADMPTAKGYIREYLQLGCRNVLIQLPYKNNEQFKNDFFELAALGPEVIMLQDWDAVGDGLPDDLILELWEQVPAFRCLKIETNPAGPKYTRMLNATNGQLHVSGGWAVTEMPDGLKRGVHAFMPTAMHQIYTRIYSLYKSGRMAEAVLLFEKIRPVLAFSNRDLHTSIYFFKRLLWKKGHFSTPAVRVNPPPAEAGFISTADRLIQQIIALEADLQTGNYEL